MTSEALRGGRTFQKTSGVSYAAWLASTFFWESIDTSALRCGTLGDMEHAQGSSKTKLLSRERDGALGNLGKDTETLVSFQREGLVVGGAGGLDALLALSLNNARFTGRDSMKLDKEEVMIVGL